LVDITSIHDSIDNESKCNGAGPSPGPHHDFPAHVVPSSNCTFSPGKALEGNDIAKGTVASKEACCGACEQTPGCVASDFVEASRMRPTFEGITMGGTCHLKSEYAPKAHASGEVQTACEAPK
jgi:hypothetical protein